MRRAALTLGGTAAGLIALFSFRTHVPGVTSVAAPSSPAALTNSAPPVTNGSATPASSNGTTSHGGTKESTPSTKAPATPTGAKPSSTPTNPAASPTPAKPAATAPRTVEGTDVNTQYGPVQVVLTVSAGKITAANDVQQPADSIGANAIGQLNQEVLTTQSANIQTVSGATYTSQGYIRSLQQAIDTAGL